MQEESSKVQEIIQKDIWGGVKDFLNWGLHLGEGENAIHVTVGLLLLLLIAFVITSFVLKLLYKLLTRRMKGDDRLKFLSIYQFVRYMVYIIVIVLTVSAAGIDITILITASAALFVGLGFALQELFQDIIGGIYIVIEKSLGVGDIIEVEGKVGEVFEIKLRTTRALTRDDKVIIIPNHKFISDVVFNYTQNHKTTRESVAVGIAYGSDVNLATTILIEVAKAHRDVLKNPKPFVIFEDFGDSALQFVLHFYITNSFTDPKIKSEIRYAIEAKFREHQINIPFPQRDIHLYRKQDNLP